MKYWIPLLFSITAFSAAHAADGPTLSSEGFVTTPDGVRLFFRMLGEGETTVLLPGATYLFDDFKRLAKGRRLIAYDLRNRGRSDAIADPAKLERGIHQDVDDVEAVRKHTGSERIAVVAHSYVAVAAALYAMKHPEHVSRAVLIGPSPPTFARTYAQPPEVSAMFAKAFKAIGEIQKDAQDEPVERCQKTWKVLAPIYVADARHAPQIERWGACELATERNAMRHFNTNILPTLKALTISKEQAAKASMPILIVHGALDRNAPLEGAKDWAALLPDGRLAPVENAAHAPWIEAPEQVFGAIENFLAAE